MKRNVQLNGVQACAIVMAALLTCSTTSEAGVAFSEIFSDHMVLQRDKPLPIWGNASPGEQIVVSFAGVSVSTNAGPNGRWEVRLPPQKLSCAGRTLTVGGKNRVEVKDVLVGDVWLVSGQSNAEMPFGWGVIDGAREMAASTNYPGIRVVKFEHRRSVLPETVPCCGKWEVCTEKTLPHVTAQGYFMARELNRVSGVPIGILDNNWSGCCIEPYISPEGFAMVPELKTCSDQVEKQLKKLATEQGIRELQGAQYRCVNWAKDFEAVKGDRYWLPDEWLPYTGHLCGQYHAMIAPIVRFPIVGATWYQGCSNGGEDQPYLDKLKGLVGGWRKAWGYDFPFYVVQLAAYGEKTEDPEGGNGYAKIRDAQRRAIKEIRNCGLVVTIDIGNVKDIHPKNKLDVGCRLARWALRDVYGKRKVEPSGPLFRELKVEGRRVRVLFDHVGGGLFAGEKGPDTPGVPPKAAADGKLRGFSISGADRVWHLAEAKIDGGSVVLTSSAVSAPIAVRYGFRANPMGDCNLYNKAGLPASPFRTDRW